MQKAVKSEDVTVESRWVVGQVASSAVRFEVASRSASEEPDLRRCRRMEGAESEVKAKMTATDTAWAPAIGRFGDKYGAVAWHANGYRTINS